MYIQLTFQNLNEAQSDLLIAQLSELGFYGFEEEEAILRAVIQENDAANIDFTSLPEELGIGFIKERIEEKNWNAEWESNFQPVFVEDFLCIRADFHPPASGVEQELIITPKMSFGTGHHATTWMMALAMRDLFPQRSDWKNQSVFDFGTGTGVLALLSARLGAKRVVAIDNDPWSIENARENAARNGLTDLDIHLADTLEREGEQFNVILANINKHIILQFMPALAERLQPGGKLLLSGLLVSDEADIVLAAAVQGLRPEQRMERDNWLCLKLSPA